MEAKISNGRESLGAVLVRPCRQGERQRLTRLLRRHHYLGFRGTVGESVFHVAEWDGRWVAVLVWAAAAFKCAVRDGWIGWHPAVAFQRLHLVANNVRFLILPGIEVPNLASRVLALSVRRLSADWERSWGHRILVVETFVDPERFRGTCYRAAGWDVLGETLGYARQSGGWRYHGRRKLVFGRELQAGARDVLRDSRPEACESRGVAKMKLSYREIDDLLEVLQVVPDPRKPRGIRHPKRAVIAIAVAATLSGMRSLVGIAQWARECTESELERFGCRRSPRTGKREAPSEPTIRRMMQSIDVEEVDRHVGDWLRKLSGGTGPAIAIDGKTARGAKRADGSRVHLLSAVLHASGVTIGQVEVDSKTNEIPAARELLAPLPLSGCCVTADALHTQVKLAQFLVEKEADYCFTVKDNQPTLKEDLSTFFANESFPPSGEDAGQRARADRGTRDLDHHGTQRLRPVSGLRPGREDPPEDHDHRDRSGP